ncbi:hypothetical protein ACFYNO_15070 [Kitasatospora sp. NPDC006697]|uniref:hypothetical protein n=1 Tax=unclassified Kitasatospora TaxID=2633591 RepID=UPI00369219FF
MSPESHNEIGGGHFGATVQARSIESLTINPAALAPRPPVQRQLPRRPPHFLDRRDITAHLTDELVRTPTGSTLPAAGSTVLVTSRSVLPGLVAVGAEHHELGPLPAAEAVELLTLLAGTRHIPDPQAVRATVEACRNRPLLIALAAARLQTRPTPRRCPTPTTPWT